MVALAAKQILIQKAKSIAKLNIIKFNKMCAYVPHFANL